MAVIESLPGIEVTIGVDGEAAKEYDVPLAHDDEDNTRPGMTRDEFDLPADHDDALPHVIKYIEVKPGAPFEFRVKKEHNFQRRGHHIGFQAFADGRFMGFRHEGGKSANNPMGVWDVAMDRMLSGNPRVGYKTHQYMFTPLGIGMYAIKQPHLVPYEKSG
jgi:hypothetical protein